MLESILVFLPFVFLAAGATSDAATMTIPNWVSIGLSLLFVPVALVLGLGWGEIGMHMLIGFAVFAACVGLFYLNVFGGGDAKLIPAVAIWFGWPGLVSFLFWMAVYGGALAASVLIARRLMPSPAGAPEWARRVLDPAEGVPYGLAIAAGAVTAWAAMPLMGRIL
jgi:prepilin peptidase CpaA